MNMTLEEKIKRLRKTVSRLRKYAPKDEDFGAEARACKRTAEGYEELANWMEELKRYKDLEEQGRLVVLPAPLKDVEFFSLDGKTKWVNFPFVPGDTVYRVTEVYQPCTAQGYLYESYSLYCDNCNDYCDSFKGYQVTEKSVKNWEDAIYLKGIAFHTREEAEAALERKRGEKCW